jgi:hypothetical protein
MRHVFGQAPDDGAPIPHKRRFGDVGPCKRCFSHDGISDAVAINASLEIRIDGSPLRGRCARADEGELALGFRVVRD